MSQRTQSIVALPGHHTAGRTRGIVHTIKDGIVMENANLMREVERMVRKSKEGVSPVNVITTPFLPARP